MLVHSELVLVLDVSHTNVGTVPTGIWSARSIMHPKRWIPLNLNEPVLTKRLMLLFLWSSISFNISTVNNTLCLLTTSFVCESIKPTKPSQYFSDVIKTVTYKSEKWCWRAVSINLNVFLPVSCGGCLLYNFRYLQHLSYSVGLSSSTSFARSRHIPIISDIDLLLLHVTRSF